jgi:hypothetical protein
MSRKPHFRRSAVATALLACVLPAAAVELQPGLWEISSKTERNGAAGAAQSMSSCLTSDQSKRLSEMSPRPQALRQGCETVDAQKTQDGFSVHVRCQAGVSVDSTTTYVLDSPSHFKGVMTSTVSTRKKTDTTALTVEGRLIGECPK